MSDAPKVVVVDDEDLDAQIAELRARKESIERQREEREQAEQKRAQIEALQREVEDEEAIAKAEDKLGKDKIAVVPTPMGAVIVKRPNHMHYRRFISLKDPSADDAERLVLNALVHPSRAAFQAIAEELPAIPVIAAGAVVDLAAGRKSEVTGKS